jgi:hypothetical protein
LKCVGIGLGIGIGIKQHPGFRGREVVRQVELTGQIAVRNCWRKNS